MSPLIKATHLLMLNSMLIVSSAAQSVELKPQVREPGVRVSASDEWNSEVAVLSLSERRALWLLDHLLEEAKSCEDETFRILTLARLADLLWKYDEPRARRQFEKALVFIDEIKAEPLDDASDSPPPVEYGRQYQLRIEVFELITQHDSEWARKLGSQTSIEQSFVPPDEAIAPALRTKANAINTVSHGAATTTPGSLGQHSKPVFNSGSDPPVVLQHVLAQAEVARTHEEKDGLYTRATLQALAENDFDQALSITRKIKSESSRASLEAMTRNRAATAALSKQDFVAAERYARGISSLVQRATVFDQILLALEKGNDIARVAETLTEAEDAFEKAENGLDKSHALLIVAGAAARTDLLRAFDITRAAIAAVNHPDSSNKSQHLTPQSDTIPKPLMFDQVFAILARVDFDRVLQLAQSIDKKEMSVAAQLAICRGLMTRSSQGNERLSTRNETGKQARSTLKAGRRPHTWILAIDYCCSFCCPPGCH